MGLITFLKEYEKYISHILTKSSDANYTTFYISKRSGGTRIINAPTYELMQLQRKLLPYFCDLSCLLESVHGFVKSRSIITNAMTHLKKFVLINIDLQDFYPSIKADKIKNLFRNHPFNLDNKDAERLKQVCTFNGYLPQGAPTSPILSNFICENLDKELIELSSLNNLSYTRYGDDITFSNQEESISRKVINDIFSIIKNEGFDINLSKYNERTSRQRQEVTGLTVNEKLNVRRKYLKEIGAILYNWDKFGLAEASQKFTSRYYKSKKRGKPNLTNSLRGKIEFIGMVRGKSDSYYVRFMNKYLELHNRDVPKFPDLPF